MPITLIEAPARSLAHREIAQLFSGMPNFADHALIIREDFNQSTLTDILSPTLWGAPTWIGIYGLDSATGPEAHAFTEGLIKALPNFPGDLVIWLRSAKNLPGLVNAVKKASGRVIQIKVPQYASERRQFLVSEFARVGKRLDRQAFDLLMANFPVNIDIVVNLVEQIGVDCPEDTITSEVMSQYLSGLQNLELFELCDAITAGNPALWTRELVKRRGQLNPMQLLGLLRTKLAHLVTAEAVVSREISLADSHLNAWYFNHKLAPEVRTFWSKARLREALENLLNAYRAILTGSANDMYVLERLAVTLV
jgi:DNA polymerase III delta subunit